MEIGYKVLTRNRHSIIVKGKAARIYYPRQKTVCPLDDCGPLCVFKTQKTAKKFACMVIGSAYYTIVKCKYKESPYKMIWTKNSATSSLKSLPRGTILADSVTCLE